MSKILYVLDDNKNSDYKYNIDEDTVIYHFSINSTNNVLIDIVKENVTVNYYYSNINYDDNTLNIKVSHLASNTHSEIFNHGVNVYNNKLTYYVDGIVLKSSSKCICNQDNQIINMEDGKSTICPNLLIDNYDVDSNHAAYIGSFNEDILFYMMSRGISRDIASRLLINGFLIGEADINNLQVKRFLNEIKKV